jgi:hypothetical protein
VCVRVLGKERKTARDASFHLAQAIESGGVAGSAVDDGYEGEEERGFDGRRGSSWEGEVWEREG